jgi:type VI secretion system secreted protein Hcp
MAVSICLRLGPDKKNLKGESVITKHENEIDVLAWNWGLTQSGTAHRATGAGAGSADVHDLTITKYVDLSSPMLIQECFNGTDFGESVLTFLKVGGGKGNQVEYLKITMSGTVMISSVTSGGSAGGDDSFTETVTLNFASVKIDFTSQTANQGKGATVSGNFDIAKKFST